MVGHCEAQTELKRKSIKKEKEKKHGKEPEFSVQVDVWWGIVERRGAQDYDFIGYQKLFHKVAQAGLKIQAVMSFHAAGTNVGDTCNITLPPWVLAAGVENPDIFYTDKVGSRNTECLSLGCLREPVLNGRTPLAAYTDFLTAFTSTFDYFIGA